MNPSRKNPSRKSVILAFIGFAALAWIKLDRITTLATTGTPETECSARDPFSRCAASLKLAYPVGDGLVFTPIMDDFF